MAYRNSRTLIVSRSCSDGGGAESEPGPSSWTLSCHRSWVQSVNTTKTSTRTFTSGMFSRYCHAMGVCMRCGCYKHAWGVVTYAEAFEHLCLISRHARMVYFATDGDAGYTLSYLGIMIRTFVHQRRQQLLTCSMKWALGSLRHTPCEITSASMFAPQEVESGCISISPN